jgi:hypothetical protein
MLAAELPQRRRLLATLGWLGLAGGAAPALSAAGPPGRRLRAGPDDYRKALGSLRPGDRLQLAPGEYARGLPLHDIAGTAEQPIVIEGPQPPARAVLVGRPGAHTVSLLDCAHLVVRGLVLDGRGARIDAVRAEGHGRWAHHIALERLTIVNHGATQQNSGISTKCLAWGWVVRGNAIIGAGTGMYFGDSDGSDPFFDALIEGNRIDDPLGYGIQIKHQHDRPATAGNEARTTVIRRNVIAKRRVAASPELARPSLLVGHWPLAGAGAGDRYLVYRNLLFDNPSEALFQGEGNLALYGNLLVNPRGEGVRIQPHNHRPREVAVFNNTIVAAALGVGFTGGEPGYARLFAHNLVCGNPPAASEVEGENLFADYDRAPSAFVRWAADPAGFDLTPRPGQAAPRLPIDARWRELPGADEDFLGRRRAGSAFGACLRTAAAGGSACR